MLSNDVITAAFVKAFKARGVSITADNIAIQDQQGLLKFCMRLGRANNPLPTREYIEAQAAQGKIKPKSQSGAFYLLLGAFQVVDPQLRVTARIVSVETSVILAASKSDADTSPDGIHRAVDDALTQLNTQFAP